MYATRRTLQHVEAQDTLLISVTSRSTSLNQLVREKERGHGLCRTCRKTVNTVYAYRDVELENPRLTVENVLVGACETCGATVTVPWQSNLRLQNARTRASEATTPPRFEARIPSELYEALRAIAAHLEARDESFSHLMLRYYLCQIARSDRFAERVHRLAGSREWGPASERLSLRVSAQLHRDALKAATEHGIADASEMFRGLIWAAYQDVFTSKASKRREFLEDLADATS